MQRKSTPAILMASLLFAASSATLQAQNVETFEGITVVPGTKITTFVNAGRSFTITANDCFGSKRFGVFIPGNSYTECNGNPGTSTGGGYGVGTSCASGVCTGTSNNFVDNGGNTVFNQVYAIKTTNSSLFTIKSLFVYTSVNSSVSPSDAGGVIFRGKIAGSVVFTYTKTTGFNTSSTNNGFTYIDFAAAGYANINIDELEMQAGNISNYFAIDNFNWGISTPLSVSLMSFTAQPKNNDVLLNWSSANETGFSHYEIERSNDGKSFSPIGKVSSGNNRSTYSYTDQQYTAGINFYRLRMVDKDGAATYSAVVSVDMGQKQNNISVYPNPATDKLSVVLGNNNSATFQLIDMTGRILQSTTLTANTTELNIASLPNGVYQYRLLHHELGLLQQGKITKK